MIPPKSDFNSTIHPPISPQSSVSPKSPGMHPSLPLPPSISVSSPPSTPSLLESSRVKMPAPRLEAELQKITHQRNLRLLKKASGDQFDMEAPRSSKNYVRILKAPVLYPKEKIEAHLLQMLRDKPVTVNQYTPAKIRNILVVFLEQVKHSDKPQSALLQEVINLDNQHERAKMADLPRFEAMLELLKKGNLAIQVKPSAINFISQGMALIQKELPLTMDQYKKNIEGLNVFYKSEDILSALRLKRHFIYDLITSKPQGLQTSFNISELTKINRSLKLLNGFLIGDSKSGMLSKEQLVKLGIFHDLSPALKNVPQFLAEKDILAFSHIHKIKDETLKILGNTAVFQLTPGFAFKTGMENDRELLAMQSTAILGLDSALALKQNYKLEASSSSGKKDVEGITSEILADFPLARISEYNAAKQNYQKLIEEAENIENKYLAKIQQIENKPVREPADTTQLKTLKAEKRRLTDEANNKLTAAAKKLQKLEAFLVRSPDDLEKSKKALKMLEEELKGELEKLSRRQEAALKLSGGEGSGKIKAELTAPAILKKEAEIASLKAEIAHPQVEMASIQKQGVLDLIYCSLDSHYDQYKLKEGRVQCIDFARYAPPQPYLSINDNFYVPMRSALLDHPAAARPLDPALLATIRGWDEKNVIAQHQAANLVMSDQAFEEVLKEFKALQNDESALKNAGKEDRDKIGESYGISSKIGEPAKEFTERIRFAIKAKENQIRSACFKKFLPAAFNAMLERVRAAKLYIALATKPTVIGLRDALYPLSQPFYKFIELKYGISGQYIVIKENNLRSLSSIIAEAQAFESDVPPEQRKELAANIKAMQNSLSKISSEGLAFTLDDSKFFQD